MTSLFLALASTAWPCQLATSVYTDVSARLDPHFVGVEGLATDLPVPVAVENATLAHVEASGGGGPVDVQFELIGRGWNTRTYLVAPVSGWAAGAVNTLTVTMDPDAATVPTQTGDPQPLEAHIAFDVGSSPSRPLPEAPELDARVVDVITDSAGWGPDCIAYDVIRRVELDVTAPGVEPASWLELRTEGGAVLWNGPMSGPNHRVSVDQYLPESSLRDKRQRCFEAVLYGSDLEAVQSNRDCVPGRGCACSASGDPTPGFLILFAPIVALRRRRRAPTRGSMGVGSILLPESRAETSSLQS